LISLRTTLVAVTILGSLGLLATPSVAYAGSDTQNVDAAKKAARERAAKKDALDNTARRAAAERLAKQRTLEAAKKAAAMERKSVAETAKKIERERAIKEAAGKNLTEEARLRAVREEVANALEQRQVVEAARRIAAQTEKQTQQAISVELTVIQASKDGTADPKLSALQNEISRSFKGYKGFTLIEKHTLQIRHADSAVKRLKNGKAVVFSNMGKDGSKLRVRLDIDGANVMMNVREGELWFHARREKGTTALILAVRARSAPR
jgi:hypothetical protein